MPRRRLTKKTGALALAKSNKRRISRIISNIENKYIIESRPLTPFVTPTEGFLLNAVTQGDNFNQRQGIVINGQFLSINIQLSNISSGLAEGMRVLIVRDKQPNGVVVNVNDIFEQPLVPDQFNSLQNVAQMNRIMIMFDRFYKMSRLGNGNQDINKFIKIRIPLRGLKITYNGNNAGLVTDMVTNAFYMFLITTETVPGNVASAYSSRLTFKDP